MLECGLSQILPGAFLPPYRPEYISLAFAAIPAWAGEDNTEPEELVIEAQKALKDFVADPDMTWFRENEKNAKGILIIPELTMGGFIFGGTVGEQVRKSKNRCNPFSKEIYN